MQCDGNLIINSHHEVSLPIIADCITDGVYPSGECWAKNDAYPSENLIDFCPGDKSLDISDAQNGPLGMKSGLPKECMDSSALVDPIDLVPMDLIEKWDEGVDVESGREINGGNGCDASFWGSAKRLVVKTFNRFIPGYFGQIFNGSTKTVEPTFCFNSKVGLCKPAEDPLKSVFANLSHKSECNNEGSPRNTGVLGSGKLRNGNDSNNIKASSKKPPRPPRPPRQAKATVDPLKEKLVKGILRRVRLERMATLKKKQIARSKSSNSSVWALAFTLCFCVIMIMQGIFSQENTSAHMSPDAAVQTSTLAVHKYDNHATNGEPRHPIEVDQSSASLYHFRDGMDKDRLIRTDP
ncbi:hypothetical protein KI387_017412, partial [Taxus chinensis]